MVHREGESPPGRSKEFAEAQAQFLQEEWAGLWDFAQSNLEQTGRGCVALSKSVSLTDLREGQVSMYWLSYFAEAELQQIGQTGESQFDNLVQRIVSLVRTYEPTREFVAVFAGAGGLESVYRIRAVKDIESDSSGRVRPRNSDAQD